MVTRVQKWGNSSGASLAHHVLDCAHIAVGDDVEVVVGKDQIVIKKVAKQRFDLAEMVARVTKKYKVKEESFGKPVGRES
jgi:antitoxin component of MazEF toxin-antitoxin module